MSMKQMLKPKAVPTCTIFPKALPSCSAPPAKRRRTAFMKSERSSVSYFMNKPLSGLCEATITAQVIAMMVAPRLCLKN